MRYLFLLLTFAFTTELEVDGVIKANSGIDANNNPITNVGIPQSMSDAINGNILQDALRDDGSYEFRLFYVVVHQPANYEYQTRWYEFDTPALQSYGFASKMTELSSEGFYLDKIDGSFWIFKRLIEE